MKAKSGSILNFADFSAVKKMTQARKKPSSATSLANKEEELTKRRDIKRIAQGEKYDIANLFTGDILSHLFTDGLKDSIRLSFSSSGYVSHSDRHSSKGFLAGLFFKDYHSLREIISNE